LNEFRTSAATSGTTGAASGATIAGSGATIEKSGATNAGSGTTIAASGAIIEKIGATAATSGAIISASGATTGNKNATAGSRGVIVFFEKYFLVMRVPFSLSLSLSTTKRVSEGVAYLLSKIAVNIFTLAFEMLCKVNENIFTYPNEFCNIFFR
jgi:hypothetical protein